MSYLALVKCKKCERIDFYNNSYAPIYHAIECHNRWHLGKSIQEMFQFLEVWR